MLLKYNSSDDSVVVLKEVMENLSWFCLSYQDNQQLFFGYCFGMWEWIL